MNPGRIPFWLMVAVIALFTVGQVFPSIDIACALVALGLTVGTFVARCVRRPR